MAKPSFKYQPRSREQIQRRAQQSGSSREGFIKDKFRQWSPSEGSHRIRILPPTWEDARHYGLDVFAHYAVGMENSSFICMENPPAGHDKETCELCQERAAAQKDGEDAMAKALKPNKRVLVWMVDRDHMNDGPQVWPMAYTIDRDVANLAVDEEQGRGAVFEVDNPDEGYDLIFKREGKDTRTKYVGLKLARRATPLSDDQDEQEEWLAYIQKHPLPSVLVIPDQDHIAEVFKVGGVRQQDEQDQRGRDRERDRDRDDDDRPRRSRRASARDEDDDRPKRRSSRDEEEDRPRRGKRDTEEEDRPKRRSSREDDDDRPKRRRGEVTTPRDYDELEAMSEEEMLELAEAGDIRLNDRETTLSQLAEALDLSKPKRRSRDEDEDDEKPKSKRKRDEDEEDEKPKPKSKKSDDDEDDDRPKRRRPRDEDEDDEKPKSKRKRDDDEDEAPRARLSGRDDNDEKPKRRDEEGSRTNRLRRGLASARD